MDGASCPPVRWRCCRESWVDPWKRRKCLFPSQFVISIDDMEHMKATSIQNVPMHEADLGGAICHTNGGNLPVEVEQTKRNKEADSVGFAQELTMTSNKKCQNEPVIGHQPGTNGESSRTSMIKSDRPSSGRDTGEDEIVEQRPLLVTNINFLNASYA
ncbi:hypothetical protein C4D60_Mb05t26160 [Musa balbisiana]|uniref:Uncharacterized protein n=1 Tax=Musa balbisiana TaxID=52838 RepID=A0A4S8JZ08_MUSBA|nr:hypothetical protein C4D60_Mb05t26160 [Musa balbisiana]